MDIGEVGGAVDPRGKETREEVLVASITFISAVVLTDVFVARRGFAYNANVGARQKISLHLRRRSLGTPRLYESYG